MAEHTNEMSMTAETSNAWGEWPARYACNGPEVTFWTDDATLANKLIAATFDRDEWTVTDTQNPTAAPQPEVHSYDPTDQRQSVTIRWPDGKCLGYVLDRTRYTDNLPPSAPVGVDFAAVASILRRAMRDGVHYGYRREFILQQALAMEALTQQPAAVDLANMQQGLRIVEPVQNCATPPSVPQRYNIDADPDGIRADVTRCVRAAMYCGANNVNPPPEGHWLHDFWLIGRAEAHSATLAHQQGGHTDG